MQFAVRLLCYYLLCSLLMISVTYASGKKFTSQYPCQDSGRTCIASGVRVIDGFAVNQDCWEYAYYKTCNYPSKDDCINYSHCYLVADLPCLLRDSYGNCVNLHKEVSCKSWVPAPNEKEVVRTSLVEKEGKDRLVCKGVPCIDGNCVDKSYMTDAEMMDSVSKLYAVSQMKDAKDLNFKLFAGFAQSCGKKATSYTNCCSTSLKGWGKQIGAGCKKDEQDLIEKRKKNLCVYVGKQNKQMMGVTTVVKHHYCCFGNMLSKVIQVEGRKQLGISFGSGGNPDCRGLTLEEIMRLDFDKMDFSEFFADILKKMKIPKIGDITARVDQSLTKVRKYDGNKANKDNNKTGWSSEIKDDSWEAEEEQRVAEEHKKQEAIKAEQRRLAELERQKQEAQRLEEEKQKEIAKQEAAKKQRRIAKERELLIARQAEQAANNRSVAIHAMYQRTKDNRYAVEYTHYIADIYQPLLFKMQKIEQDLKNGNY